MQQVLYKLPDGWSWRKLSELAKTTSGGTPSRSNKDYWGGSIPWVKSGELGDSRVEKNEEFITELGLKNSSAKLFPKESLLLALYGATAGKLGVLTYDAATNQAVCCISQDDQLLARDFLRYYLLSQRKKIIEDSFGGAQPNISQAYVREIDIPTPPLTEQKRIVEKLDALLTRIDTAIEHLQESVTLADALYASELNEVFPSDSDIESLTDKDGWVSLSDICSFENGDRGKNYPSKSAFVAEGIPVVSAGNLGERYIDHKGLNYITSERYDLLRSGRIRVGDILFCLRGSLGKVAISKDINEGVIASSLVIIRPKDRVSAEYIFKYLKSSLCQKFISYYNNGAAQPNLSAKSLGKFMLPLPNADCQKLIVNGLDEKYQLNQKLLVGLNSKIISLQSLKASILDSAFRGEL